jgi:antibiotic biosynthesis monooxygenase (ABM) superfamily enzyme
MIQQQTNEHNHPATQSASPVKWKLWLLTVVGIYPLLTVLVTATAPLLDSLAPPLRLAIIVPIAVAAMVWVVMPFLTRRFARWLTR